MGTKLSKSPSSSQRQSPAATSGNDECAICLQPVAGRGGVPIMSPGCCGKFFHQPCVDQMIASGNSSCPNCRTAFPVVPQQLPQQPVLPVQQQLPPMPPPRLQSRRSVNQQVPNSNPPQLSPQEEPIDESDRQFEISSGSTTLASTQPVIVVSCTPERFE